MLECRGVHNGLITSCVSRGCDEYTALFVCKLNVRVQNLRNSVCAKTHGYNVHIMIYSPEDSFYDITRIPSSLFIEDFDTINLHIRRYAFIHGRVRCENARNHCPMAVVINRILVEVDKVNSSYITVFECGMRVINALVKDRD